MDVISFKSLTFAVQGSFPARWHLMCGLSERIPVLSLNRKANLQTIHSRFIPSAKGFPFQGISLLFSLQVHVLEVVKYLHNLFYDVLSISEHDRQNCDALEASKFEKLQDFIGILELKVNLKCPKWKILQVFQNSNSTRNAQTLVKKCMIKGTTPPQEPISTFIS